MPAKKPDDKWLSENESALLSAIKVLCQLLATSGAAKPETIDAALLAERDQWAARGMAQGAAILEMIVMLRQRADQSPSELPTIVTDLPKGRA